MPVAAVDRAWSAWTKRNASIGSPKRSAAICGKLVSCPCPFDWVPSTSAIRRSGSKRISARSPGVPRDVSRKHAMPSPRSLPQPAAAREAPGQEKLRHFGEICSKPPGINRDPKAAAIREATDQIVPAQRNRVEAARGAIDEPLDQVIGFRLAGAAIGVHGGHTADEPAILRTYRAICRRRGEFAHGDAVARSSAIFLPCSLPQSRLAKRGRRPLRIGIIIRPSRAWRRASRKASKSRTPDYWPSNQFVKLSRSCDQTRKSLPVWAVRKLSMPNTPESKATGTIVSPHFRYHCPAFAAVSLRTRFTLLTTEFESFCLHRNGTSIRQANQQIGPATDFPTLAPFPALNPAFVIKRPRGWHVHRSSDLPLIRCLNWRIADRDETLAQAPLYYPAIAAPLRFDRLCCMHCSSGPERLLDLIRPRTVAAQQPWEPFSIRQPTNHCEDIICESGITLNLLVGPHRLSGMPQTRAFRFAHSTIAPTIRGGVSIAPIERRSAGEKRTV